MEKKDKIVLIIPSYNGLKYWDDLMPILSQEKYSDFDLEIVIVDNNSSDHTVAYLQSHYPDVKVIINEENTGYVGANNVGYDYARQQQAQYIYLLNQDTIVTPGFLQPLYDYAKKNKFGSLQSKIRLWSPETRPLVNSLGNDIHYLGFGYATGSNLPDQNDQAIKAINYASGAGVLVSMAALEDLGYLFDETMFMYLEDLDLGWSLQLLGYENYLIPQSVIYHKYEFDRSFKQVYWFERNRLWVMLKNYKLLSLILIFPAWLLMEIGQILFAWKNDYLRKKIDAYKWLIDAEQWDILWSKRKKIQAQRRVNDQTIAQRFVGQILFQPLESSLLKVANFCFNIYWQIIRVLIIW